MKASLLQVLLVVFAVMSHAQQTQELILFKIADKEFNVEYSEKNSCFKSNLFTDDVMLKITLDYQDPIMQNVTDLELQVGLKLIITDSIGNFVGLEFASLRTRKYIKSHKKILKQSEKSFKKPRKVNIAFDTKYFYFPSIERNNSDQIEVSFYLQKRTKPRCRNVFCNNIIRYFIKPGTYFVQVGYSLNANNVFGKGRNAYHYLSEFIFITEKVPLYVK
jgi:hypothetical protein